MAAASKLLANMVYYYKGLGLSIVREPLVSLLVYQSSGLVVSSWVYLRCFCIYMQGTMICGWDKKVTYF